MKQVLSNKVAIVTGSSRGIGRAIALKLAEDGAAVMLAARNGELLQEVRTEIESKGGNAAWLSLDLRKPEVPALLVEKTFEVLGGIDIVVNNAGATKRGDFLTLSEEDWTDGFALKFFGAVRLLRAAWPALKERKDAVVNIAGWVAGRPGHNSRLAARLMRRCFHSRRRWRMWVWATGCR
jgi:3-oxoacyl-[acyl-carrier protein] reductase